MILVFRSMTLCAIAASMVSGASTEASHGARFEGTWTGSGQTRTNTDDTPIRVRCEAAGTFEETTLTISGSCWAFGIFRREFGAEISYNDTMGGFRGTYYGSRAGPSLLNGHLDGDVLSLNVTWPRIINGDDRASMVLSNRGDGRFTLQVEDIAPDTGATVVITSIAFQRR